MMAAPIPNAPWFKHIVNGNDTCIVVFSSFATRDYGPEAFSYINFFGKHSDKVDILFIKDVGNQWYNGIIEGVGQGVEDTVDWLKSKLDPYKTVRFFGSSMGAYASLLFGSRLGADHIIALSPQTFLRAPFPRFSARLHRRTYIDLKDEDLSSAGRVDVIMAEEDLFDIYQLCTLRRVQQLHITIVPKSDHNVPEFLNDRGDFVRVIDAYCTGVAPALIDGWMLEFAAGSYVTPRLDDASFVDGLRRYIDAKYGGDQHAAMVALAEITPNDGAWAGAQAALGLAKLDGGALLHGIDLLQGALERAPSIKDGYRPLVRALCSLMRFDEADRIARARPSYIPASIFGEIDAVKAAYAVTPAEPKPAPAGAAATAGGEPSAPTIRHQLAQNL